MMRTLVTTLWSLLLLQTPSSAFQCSVESVQHFLPAGSTALRALSLPDNLSFSDPSEVAYPGITSALPALCLLTINVTSSRSSSYRFGLFLSEVWNGRFAAVGNGGLAGGINWPSMGTMAKYGFAVVSTDTGHNGTSSDGTFALNGNETITDNAYRAMHGSVEHAKAIVQEHYGRNISYSYYSGCSTGGRQGLVELQKYPEDFDGVLVGAPAWESTKIAAFFVQMGVINLPKTSDHHIPPSLYPLIQAEAIQQCDGVDGVEDGVISDPQACHFRAETLLCTPGSNTSTCLTDPQINTLHLLYGHYFDVARPLFYYALPPGSEAGWSALLPSDAPLSLGTNAFAYVQLQDPNWDWRELNISIIVEKDATGDRSGIPEDFDIRPFADHELLPYKTSRTFYEAVYRNISSQDVAYTVDDFYRLFYVPGMLHCSEDLGRNIYGVPGFEDANHDAVLALMHWVEKGEAPKWITATKFVNESIDLGVRRQRKLCPYPKTARLVGDDVHDAGSWEC
ncbi:tannase and feruloyl esterase-domain-containing protein [Lophiotrema nucula]|uniref:Carboxylic ester hydrolase n=1 Tax=Lophiotrema nucula TaxID=690887 RepID=A0A6A5Z6D0_9PLEO|nr:tannase and feruloyl esterase-domain-containing protein [Lophiotrema nucula]